MAKFTIVLCVLISAYGARAGILSIGTEVVKSNAIAIMDQMQTAQTDLETAMGMSVEEFVNNIATISNEKEEELSKLMSETSGSSACSTYITQLREARNATVDTMVSTVQSMIDSAKDQTAVAMSIGEVILDAANSAETKIIECLSNFFTMASCFQEIRTVVVANVTSNLPTLLTSAIELTTNQATIMVNMGSFQISAMNDFNSIVNDLSKVSQECVAQTSNTV